MRRLMLKFSLLSAMALAFSRCTPVVSSEDVYHSTTVDSTLAGGQNIAVELTTEGMKVTGSELAVIEVRSSNSLQIKTIPEDKDPTVSMHSMEIDNRSGDLVMKAGLHLGEGSVLPAVLPASGGSVSSLDAIGFRPGAAGSNHIEIKIDPQVGYTEVAGLRFEDGAILNIWSDGTVEVNRSGVHATDHLHNIRYVSKKVKYNDRTVTLMVRG